MVEGFSATGLSGTNCFARETEFVKGGNGASPIPPRPKQAPERYSEGCIPRSISSSLLPRVSWTPLSSKFGPIFPAVSLECQFQLQGIKRAIRCIHPACQVHESSLWPGHDEDPIALPCLVLLCLGSSP